MKHENVVKETRDRKRSDSPRNRRIRSDFVVYRFDIHVADGFAVDMSVAYIHDDLTLVVTKETLVDYVYLSCGRDDILRAFRDGFDLFGRSA